MSTSTMCGSWATCSLGHSTTERMAGASLGSATRTLVAQQLVSLFNRLGLADGKNGRINIRTYRKLRRERRRPPPVGRVPRLQAE